MSFSTETSPLIRRDDDLDYHIFNLQQSVVQAQQVVYRGNYYFLWQSYSLFIKCKRRINTLKTENNTGIKTSSHCGWAAHR